MPVLWCTGAVGDRILSGERGTMEVERNGVVKITVFGDRVKETCLPGG
jgi:hypothetical protein